MKREDEYYSKWLDKLKTTQPILERPDELTAAIMQRVSQSSLSLPRSTKKNRRLLIGRWGSLVAASLLLCLLVGETFFSTATVPTKEEAVFAWRGASVSLPENWVAMNRIEKSSYLSSICRQKELRRMKKERMIENRIKNQIKSADYEKE